MPFTSKLSCGRCIVCNLEITLRLDALKKGILDRVDLTIGDRNRLSLNQIWLNVKLRLSWRNQTRDLTVGSQYENIEQYFKNDNGMRLISKKNLLSAIEPYPDDAQTAIESWYQLIKDNDWQSLEELRNGYSRSVDEVYGYTIFNIKGSRYRLIVRINYRRQILYFKKFLTHAEYSKINWNDRDEVEDKIG